MRRALEIGMVLSVLAAPRVALACGGFFCSSSPVDQAGERIVYGIEADGTLTMAVEIEYSGQDDDFAWIVPVPAPPEISVGSQALFDALDAATVPLFVRDERTEGTCRSHPRCVYAGGGTAYTGGGCGFDSSPMPWSGGYVDASASTGIDAGRPDLGLPDDGVRVFSQGAVGPYDTVVLGSTSATEVVTWLRDHGYDVPAGSLPLLEPYAAQGHVFVALRLSSNARTQVLRPLVLRMAAAPCLPIRLTAIATVPDLPITAFFLGSAFVTPSNYSFVDVPTDDPSFWTGGRTWQGAVATAVDAAGGHAFATDYAGPTPLVEVALPSIVDLATTRDPGEVLSTLQSRGYAGDALLLELLERHLAPPAGMEPRDYYNCLAQQPTASCGAPARFDAAALVAAIDAEITGPRAEAQALVLRHGRLTRLFTVMASDKMTIDPEFVVDEGLTEVSNVHRAALVTECSDQYYAEDAPQRWELAERAFPARAAGSVADDVAYCRRFGAYVEGTEPERESDSGCDVGGPLPLQGGALGLAGVVILVRRLRRRLRRRPDARA